MNYQVKTSQYTGPLDKLLELIEAKQMDINQISMAEVTADFLHYIKSFGQELRPEILADFLVVAAQLVLIKSKILLPSLELTGEEEGDIHDLESRLKIYREFKKGGEYVKNLWDKKHVSLFRELFQTLGDTPVFYPPPELSVQDIVNAMNRLFNALKEFLPESAKKIKITAVSLESKIKELLSRFQEAAEHSLKTLAKSGKKEEVVVFFLAILHLLKERIISVEQKDQFSDIILRKSQ